MIVQNNIEQLKNIDILPQSDELLPIALQIGNIQAAEILLDKGTPSNKIWYRLNENSQHILEYAIDKGLDINTPIDNMSPLRYIMRIDNENLTLSWLLLNRGAKLQIDELVEIFTQLENCNATSLLFLEKAVSLMDTHIPLYHIHKFWQRNKLMFCKKKLKKLRIL